MKRLSTIILIFAFSSFSCQDKPIYKGDTLYFEKNEIADDDWADSLMNRYYSEKLQILKEPSLKDTSNHNETIRLTVFPSFYNTYCIRLDKLDSTYSIVYKLTPDPKSIRRTGLNGLTLDYKSNFDKMDTVYQELKEKINAFDLSSHNNATPETVRNMTPADGTDFLLEYYVKGNHVAIVRWDGFLEDKYYDKSTEFIELINKMNSLVPDGLIPDFQNARKIEDLRYPIFKENKREALR